MDDANERPGDHLPWARDNDRMPGRAASTYVRIPVEIARAPRPPAAEPSDDNKESGPESDSESESGPEPEPSVTPDIEPTPAESVVRHRPLRDWARRKTREPERIDRGPGDMPGLSLAAALPGLLALLGLVLASVSSRRSPGSR